MDVNNLGSTDLLLRLLFEDPMGAPPENEAFTTSLFLPAGKGWTAISFLVDPGSLIVEEASALNALQNATILRIFSNPEAEGPDEAEPIAAMLGVDNIESFDEVATMGTDGRRDTAQEGPNIPDAPPNPNPPSIPPPGVPATPSAPPTPTDEPPPKPIDDPPPDGDPKPPYTVR